MARCEEGDGGGLACPDRGFARAEAGARGRRMPGGRHFGSREGYGLTYTSCQESGKSRGLYRLLAAEMGTDEKTISLLLKNKAV